MDQHDLIGNFINGEWAPSRSGKTIGNLNPATGEALGRVVVSEREEAEAAIAAAKAALPMWRRTPAPKRGEVLARAAVEMTRRKEALARAMTLEEGKTLSESLGEIQKAINNLEFQAGESRRLNGETVPSELPATMCWTQREPLGVVALVTPWNFPVAIPVWKIAPALVCGNTVVLKPASLTPWTAKMVAEIFQTAGLPKGVLNVVFGPGNSVGDALISHPDVRAISFTGSNEVGTRVYAQGAALLKKVQCEMGGKNPLIVLEDADLELAASAAVQGAFGSTGQRCTATSRAVVHERVVAEFTGLVTEKAKRLKVGSGLEADVNVGPSVDEAQWCTVLEYIELGKREGAKLICGGERVGNRGFFIQPTIFAGVKSEMRIAQEEIFGPVLSIISVVDFDEAIDVANGVKFGLSSAIFTKDSTHIFQYLERIESGIAHVNSPTVGGEAQLPFGGMKATGVGAREMGRTAIEFYSEWKTVYVDYTGARRSTNVY
jgi:acyl-CoA reductase-like NAD-dependent aldehyde dehydrogenase